ncbi:muscarinic acetylcholine receptor M3-like [Rhopilema esculentum]|uniref:muscarinic acetylcholine receptor M3-like n=1 Tax=Rhopilema esculentum TaxID=499914 RepID=UPI0031CFC7C6|eukprot:gene16194-7565_t
MEAKDVYWIAAIIIGLSVIVANSIVIGTFCRFKRRILRRKVNRFLLSLAFADLLVGVFSVSLATCLLSNQRMMIYKMAGNIPLFGSFFASILSLSLFSFDRLIAIQRPLRYYSIVTCRRIAVFLASSWGFSFLMCVQQYSFFFGFSFELELRARGTIMIICFFVGATVLIVTNALLYKAIKKQYLKTTESESFSLREQGCGEDNGRGDTSKRRLPKRSDLAASRECLCIVIVFICCYLPLSLYRLVYTYGISINDIHGRRLCLLFALLSSFINPWIYFFKRKQFRALYSKRSAQSDEESFYL